MTFARPQAVSVSNSIRVQFADFFLTILSVLQQGLYIKIFRDKLRNMAILAIYIQELPLHQSFDSSFTIRALECRYRRSRRARQKALLSAQWSHFSADLSNRLLHAFISILDHFLVSGLSEMTNSTRPLPDGQQQLAANSGSIPDPEAVPSGW